MRFALPVLLLLATSAPAQTPPGRDPASPFMGVLAQMNRELDGSPLTGEADRDFVFLLLAQRRASVALAAAYLKSGRDADIRRLAQTVMAGDDKEVRFMRGWQAKHQQR